MSETKASPPPERRQSARAKAAEPARHVFYEVLRWIARHVRGFHTAVGLFLSVGFAIALVAVALFASLAEEVLEGATQRFDDGVLLWLNSHASEQFDVAALEVTALGSGTVVWMTVLVASAFLWASRHRYSAALLWIAVLGGTVLNILLKNSFNRPRPQLFEWRTPHAGLSSFPSGHAMTSFVVYWTLAYLLTRLETSVVLRQLTWLIAILVILMIGVTRLYLGVHYPSDVLAGFVIGFAWATFCATGIEVVRYFRTRRPEIEEEEKDLDGVVAIEEPARA